MSQQILPCPPPPPPQTVEGGLTFFVYVSSVPKKCPQRKACTFRSYSS